MRYWSDADFYQNDIAHFRNSTLELCMDRCLRNTKCQAFTYDHQNRHNCWLKSKARNYKTDQEGLTTGMRCTHAPPVNPPKAPDGYYGGNILYLS